MTKGRGWARCCRLHFKNDAPEKRSGKLRPNEAANGSRSRVIFAASFALEPMRKKNGHMLPTDERWLIKLRELVQKAQSSSA